MSGAGKRSEIDSDPISASIPLERWQLRDFDPDAGSADAAIGDRDAAGWLDVSAPGDTYAALIAANRLAHPFAGRNEAAAAWVAEREWRWKTRFDAEPARAGERAELVFDGLDTFADIHLNGALIGSADNMFREWRFDIGAHLRTDGINELVVVFEPTSRVVQPRPMPNWGPMTDKMAASKRNLMRKAQFGWGWDWGPTLPTVGIWRPVRLERWRSARIDDVRASVVSLTDDRCELRVEVGPERAAAAAARALQAVVALRDPDGAVVAEATWPLDESGSATLVVDRPRRWWTADLGPQPLYELAVELRDAGVTIDRHLQKIGLRTIALDQSPDPGEPGTSFFRFVLNGVPIVARGACWIPASSFVGIVDGAHFRKLLEQALRSNMNMIRVWGGGVYEHDAFYDLCDEMGLLVWQDFMFACAPYPEDDAAYVESVREEARCQVRRLRHHASLALWCGNNECQVLQEVVDKALHASSPQPLAGALYYDRILPEVVAALDPSTPYWPGSPWGGPIANSMRAGDVHDWTVWHGVPPVFDDRFVGERDLSPAGVHYHRYAEDRGRFISEFGIHSAPSLASLRRWMNPEDLRLGSPGFIERIKDEPKDKVYAMLEPVTGLPATIEEYVDFTMLLQAEGLKFGIEHFRRRKPHCSGMLIWQLNDCWPCVSWSLLDYDGDGKASFYAVSRAYAPVLASFKPLDGGGVELWITNDTLQPVEGEAVLDLLRLDGGTEWSANVRHSVPANSSRPVWSGAIGPGRSDLVLCVRSRDRRFEPNRWRPAPIKDLSLVPGAMPRWSITQRGPHELEVDLAADAWLLFVALESPHAGTVFSDNYFDLRPGFDRKVHVVSQGRPILAGDLRIRCWNNR